MDRHRIRRLLMHDPGGARGRRLQHCPWHCEDHLRDGKKYIPGKVVIDTDIDVYIDTNFSVKCSFSVIIIMCDCAGGVSFPDTRGMGQRGTLPRTQLHAPTVHLGDAGRLAVPISLYFSFFSISFFVFLSE